MQMLAQLLKAIKNHVTGQTLQKNKAYKEIQFTQDRFQTTPLHSTIQ
jgi:hypothetical protein